MDAVIARYLPEFPADQGPVRIAVQAAAQAQAQAQARPPALPRAHGPAPEAFDDPWAGLVRAPRAPLPVAASPDAIRAEPVRAPAPPEGPAEGWREGLHPAAARLPDASPVPPLAAKPPAARRETPEERAALIAAAEERGRRQGLAEAREEAEAARRQAAEAAEARLADARRHWSAAEAEALADGFSAALRALDAALSDRIARLLVPVLTDALRRQAVAELSGALARLLAEPKAASVRVSGPEDLLAALAARIGPLAAAVSFTPSETADVQVSADQTVIDTQLGAWTRLIAAAVAET